MPNTNTKTDEQTLVADGFEGAFLGFTRSQPGRIVVAVYSLKKGVELLMSEHGISFEEALEHMEFNVIAAWAGPGTPMWLNDLDEDEDTISVCLECGQPSDTLYHRLHCLEKKEGL